MDRTGGARLESQTASRRNAGFRNSEGQSYMTYFWISGCPPCMTISGYLPELQKQHEDSGFTLKVYL
ncbi:MAG: hypothetical protein P8Z37_19015 [Acidobacteriota bacterium]